MSLIEDDIVKIAKLARIAITQDERKIFAKELSGILNLVEQLQEVDTDNTDRMTRVSNSKLTLRKDEVHNSLPAELIVQNAAKSEYNCFVVPKVIE
jgi:aspartyl-tRNA(Asn)/glutamyl-tRNA(Gln) amidotransferase subunit C